MTKFFSKSLICSCFIMLSSSVITLSFLYSFHLFLIVPCFPLTTVALFTAVIFNVKCLLLEFLYITVPLLRTSITYFSHFWRFQGVHKWTIGTKWVRLYDLSYLLKEAVILTKILSFINSFHTTGLFLDPLKLSKNQRFSYFQGV